MNFLKYQALMRISLEKAIAIKTAARNATKKAIKGGAFRFSFLRFQQWTIQSRIERPNKISETAIDSRELTTAPIRAREIHRSQIRSSEVWGTFLMLPFC